MKVANQMTLRLSWTIWVGSMSSQVFVSVKREAGEEERIVVTEVEVCWL
jgi:hypothetical protein